ncbi:MAG: hypothetical protein ABH835_02805 [Patescibacteria group bacterium]
MAKREGSLTGKRTKKAPHKTKKRLAVKAAMLKERAEKKAKFGKK